MGETKLPKELDYMDQDFAEKLIHSIKDLDSNLKTISKR